jgi:phosphocarrier protein HPr
MPELANSLKPEAVVIIRNVKGLHARASAKFVKLAESFDANVTVTHHGNSVGGTSIMGLMMLAAGPGSKFTVHAIGADATKALAEIESLIKRKFDEE